MSKIIGKKGISSSHKLYHIAALQVDRQEALEWTNAKLGLKKAQPGRSLSPEEIAAYAMQNGEKVSDPASPRQQPAVKPGNRRSIVRQILNSKSGGPR